MKKRLILIAALLTIPTVAAAKATISNMMWLIIMISVLGFCSFLTGLYFIAKYNEMRRMTEDNSRLTKCLKSAGVYTIIVPAISMIALRICMNFVEIALPEFAGIFTVRKIFIFFLGMVLLATVYGILRIIRIKSTSKAQLRQEIKYIP